MLNSTDHTSVTAIKQRILENLERALARQPNYATRNDWYTALAMTVRGLLVGHWYSGTDVRSSNYERVVAYLSAEFLLGPHLHNNIIGLGIYPQVERAVAELGQNLKDLIWQEQEPGLGNGGLGRLAACYHGFDGDPARCQRSAMVSGTSSASSARKFATDGKWR